MNNKRAFHTEQAVDGGSVEATTYTTALHTISHLLAKLQVGSATSTEQVSWMDHIPWGTVATLP